MAHTTPLSVIVTFYDETAFLSAALTSIESQGIAGLQTIVVNDNPACFTQADLRSLCAPLSPLILMHRENLGLSAARNTGIGAADGQYIAFLDADDYYVPDGLRAHLAYAQSTEADVVHAPTYFTQPGSVTPRILPRDSFYFCSQRSCRGLRTAEEAQFVTSSWSSLYKRDFLKDRDLRFDPEQRKFEDRLFVLQAVTQARSLAFLGKPTRVWRGRAGSISSSPTTADTHLLQIQLLEKCERLMRGEVASKRLPQRFAKRELFNTVSRLIWDLDVIPAILNSADPIYEDLAARIPELLGSESFGQQIFSDPILAPISRVGMKTRKGKIRRTDFFEIHKALRHGDFASAQAQIDATQPPPPRRPTPKRSADRLVLHVGLHKTGSTFLQHQLHGHRDALRARGVLFPDTGLAKQSNPLRPGAMAGHQTYLGALRQNDPIIWATLGREIRASRASTVVMSAENMAFPTAPDRDVLIPRLLDRLGGFEQIDVVAFIRRPDIYLEHFWREWVADGAAAGAQTLRAFLVDHAENLTDLPKLFAPFEDRLGQKVTLIDYDAAVAKEGLWRAFCAATGLPGDLPVLDAPRYVTPDRSTTEVLRLINTIVPKGPRRQALARSWLALHPDPVDRMSLLAPSERAGLIEQWNTRSAAFASERGVTPDLDLSAPWTPFEGLDATRLDRLGQLLAQDAQPSAMQMITGTSASQLRAKEDFSVTFRLRPWAANLVRRIKRIKFGTNSP